MKAHLSAADQPTSATATSWPWFGDWVKVNGARAELMAGQHRVEALKTFRKKGRLQTSSDAEPLWWVCDVYDRGRYLRRHLSRRRS
jgi:hypothetical protein